MSKFKRKTLWWLSLLLIIGGAIFLRLYQINELPPSPYWEEVALGYDAFSILKTGHDHHGHLLPIAALESFGDWKPAGYFYALLPFIKIWGLNVWSVRLPSALSGILIVIGCGILFAKIASLSGRRDKHIFFILGLAVAAISPWAIFFSRAAWEVNLATALITWGVVFFFQFLGTKEEHHRQKNKLLVRLWWLGLAIISLVLATYCYHAARIIAPSLGIFLMMIWWRKERFRLDRSKLILLVFSLVLGLSLLWPQLQLLQNQAASQRFRQTSIFYQLDVIEKSNYYKEAEGNSWLARIFYHRYVLFSQEIIKNYFSYLSADFLVISGDTNPRHSLQYFGHFYYLDLVFLILGVYYLSKKWNQYHAFLLFWLVIGIFPAAISKTNPHALRILPTLPVWLYILCLGMRENYLWLKTKLSSSKWHLVIKSHLGLILIGLIYLGQVIAFWRVYSHTYASKWSQEWQYGYQEMVETINQEKNSAYPPERIYISREQGRPAMYYWFFSLTDPSQVQAADQKVKKDQGEFLEFAELTFFDRVEQIQTPALVASTPNQAAQLADFKTSQIIKEVKRLDGSIVWVIYYIN